MLRKSLWVTTTGGHEIDFRQSLQDAGMDLAETSQADDCPVEWFHDLLAVCLPGLWGAVLETSGLRCFLGNQFPTGTHFSHRTKVSRLVTKVEVRGFQDT